MSIAEKSFRGYGTSSDASDEENTTLLPLSSGSDVVVNNNSNRPGYKVLLSALIIVATFIGAFLVAGSGSTASQGKKLSFISGESPAYATYDEEVTDSFVTVFDPENTMDGYILFSFMLEKRSFLMDNKGYVMNTWDDDYIAGQNQVITQDGYLLKAINLENPNFPTQGLGGGVRVMDFDNNIIDELIYDSDTYTTHHDVKQMNNGNILVVAWDRLSVYDMIDKGMDPAQAMQWNATGITSERIIEFDMKTKEKVWEWSVLDHLVQNQDASKPNFQANVASHPHLVDLNYIGHSVEGWTTNWDWLHANAVEYVPDKDIIIISIHNMNELWFIDKSTTTAEAASHSGGKYGKGGDLLFRWGNPSAYSQEGKTYVSDRLLYLQHDPTDISMMPNHGGNILLFNNGEQIVGRDWTAIQELYIDYDKVLNSNSIDTYATNEADIVWDYSNKADAYFSSDTGSAMRLPTGSTFINWGNRGFFSEIDVDQTEVWKWEYTEVNDDGDSGVPFFRAYKYPSTYSGFDGIEMKDQGVNLHINDGQGPLTVLDYTPSTAVVKDNSAEKASVQMNTRFGSDHFQAATRTDAPAPVPAPAMPSPPVEGAETQVAAPVVDTAGKFDAGEETTDVPVDTPADVPVDTPTDVPVDTPTDVPVDNPTDVPVDIPTDAPVAPVTVEARVGAEHYAATKGRTQTTKRKLSPMVGESAAMKRLLANRADRAAREAKAANASKTSLRG